MKKFLLPFIFALSFQGLAMAQESDLTLYFIPSPHGMDWSTPASLAKSAAMNRFSFKSRFIGHVWAEVRCGEKQVLTGMIGKKFDYFNQLLIQNKGLGILFHSFEGTLENADDIKKEMLELIEAGRINYARFILNEKNCQRLVKYAEEYKANKVDRHYGLSNRPRFAEGAGCSAFGASFLDVAGILDTEILEEWSKTVNIPLELAGPPVRDDGVSLFKVIMSANAWAKPTDEHKKIFFFDPDSMYNWAQKRINSPESYGDYKKEERNKMKGIVFDRSNRPAPESPIWLQHQDEQYHEALKKQTKK